MPYANLYYLLETDFKAEGNFEKAMQRMNLASHVPGAVFDIGLELKMGLIFQDRFSHPELGILIDGKQDMLYTALENIVLPYMGKPDFIKASNTRKLANLFWSNGWLLNNSWTASMRHSSAEYRVDLI